MFEGVLDSIQMRISEFFSAMFNFDWIPEIWIWYWFLFLFFLAAGAIIYFFGWSKIVRIVTSVLLLVAAIFVAGGKYMEYRLKKKEPPPPVKPLPPPPTNPIDGFWPWNR